ncbi:hypothetical protein SUGI_0253790 [Cryptomeria japonica]|nr:hypothetical protein SUGI_0253790 [Cryptomeria japonica]
MWVHLFCLLLVGLSVCSAARLVAENKELPIPPAQNLKEEAAETKPWSTSGIDVTKEKANNLLEYRFRETRTGVVAEHESAGLKVQGLSTSENSPGVGHMQISRGAMKKRILGSSPSPGKGH